MRAISECGGEVAGKSFMELIDGAAWSLDLSAWRMSRAGQRAVAARRRHAGRAARTICIDFCRFNLFHCVLPRVESFHRNHLRHFLGAARGFASGGGRARSEIERARSRTSPGNESARRRFANAERGSNFLHGEFFE